MRLPAPPSDLQTLLREAQGRAAAWMFEVCSSPRPSAPPRQGADSRGGGRGQRRG
jgi:hypothetical protein